jgi:uncharacterized membrane protein YeaQ/YmgE (transglycosylase-associated protein family)
MRMDALTAALAGWMNSLMVWIGYGAVVGLISKAILPGKDPGGTLGTVFVGVFGSIIGAATVFFFSGERVEPISIVGFLAALGGAALLLINYRLLHGKAFPLGFVSFWRTRQRTRRSRGRRVVVEENASV